MTYLTPAPTVDANSSVYTFIVFCLISIWSNISFGKGIADVSCAYTAKFSPAKKAFIIWLPIYLLPFASAYEQLATFKDELTVWDARTTANVCYAIGWLCAAVWTPVFTSETRLGFMVAAFCLCICASMGLISVVAISTWSKTSNFFFFSRAAYASFAGWTMVAALLNVVIAHKARKEVSDSQCTAYPENYSIFSEVDPHYATPLPLVLSICVSLLSMMLPDFVLPLPLIWAIFYMQPSCMNYTAFTLLCISCVVAATRLLL